jgi:hypothetical protein
MGLSSMNQELIAKSEDAAKQLAWLMLKQGYTISVTQTGGYVSETEYNEEWHIFATWNH